MSEIPDLKKKTPRHADAPGHALVIVSKGGGIVPDAPLASLAAKAYDINTYLPHDFQRAAEEIRGAYDTARDATRVMGDSVMRIGGLLLLVKERLGHGFFAKWVTRNCPFKPREAQGYMRVVTQLRVLDKADPAKAQRVAHSSLREALKLLAEPKQATIFKAGEFASGGWGITGVSGRGYDQRSEEPEPSTTETPATPAQARARKNAAAVASVAAASAKIIDALGDASGLKDHEKALAWARHLEGWARAHAPKPEAKAA
jgi:hypothetical protein